MLYFMNNPLIIVLCSSLKDFVDCAEIAYNTPIDAIVMIREVFPELIKGKGKPVGGMLPLTTKAFITV